MGFLAELFNFFAEPIMSSSDIYLVKKADNCFFRRIGRAKRDTAHDESHWALRIDGKYYHLGVRKDKKMIYLNTKWFTLDKAVKPKKVGTTRKTHQIIKERGLWVAQIMNNRGGYHLVSNNCQDFVNFLFNEIDEEQHPPALSSIGLHRPRKEKHKDLFSIQPLESGL
ncbi:hypothetical protein AX14_010152 [Amanita brunnescens Koide BX004]|nr:hypothetical protein AX14_010152 [Amanita brunnescens Koide BX004]